MSLWTPPSCFTKFETSLTTPAAPPGTTVTGGAANTKGSYAQLIASSAFDCYAILVEFNDNRAAGVARTGLCDIAIGAAASETVIIPNLNCGYAGDGADSNACGGQRYFFPLYIPSGSRISARMQSAAGAVTTRTFVHLFGGPTRPVWAGTTVTDYGTNLATSRGATVVPGTAGEGTWTQVVASTTQAHSYVAAGFGLDGSTNVAASIGYFDLGLGAATEVAIIENMPYGMSSAEQVAFYYPIGIAAPVASGTRIAARAYQRTGVASNIDVIAYGVS